MFAKRLISSLILWSTLLSVLFYLPASASALLCCLLATIALAEFYDMLRKGDLKCAKMLGLSGGLLFSAGTWWFSSCHPGFTNSFEVLFLVCLVLGLFIRQLMDHDGVQAVQTIGNTLLGVIYVPWLFGFIPKIKYLYVQSGLSTVPGPGWLFVFYLVVVTKFCDIGAYVVGRMFGRHKMIPRISPNKTWEGLFGGLVIAVIASIATFRYLEPRISVVGFGSTDAVIMGIVLGSLGVLGDLGESLLKRETHVKDSGGVLPGIGGALDLIDSLLFTAPALYAYLVLFVKVH